MSFVHLHNHTHYSILEGLSKPEEYAKKAKELEFPAVAITDTGNIYGCHELYKSCLEEGIKPILGTEIFVESSLDPNINHKLVLLAKTLNGYKNIIKLITKANLDNPGKEAKIKLEDIKNLKENYDLQSADKKKNNLEKILDIICLSGDINGEISYYILSGKNDEEIISRINEYKKLFGEENYFLELLYHDDIPKQNFVTNEFIKIHRKHNIGIVATNNCYYLDEKDKKTQDIIMALGTGHELENPDRRTFINGNHSFLSREDMESLFGFIPIALENTLKISKMIDIKIETGGVLIPKFELPDKHKKIYEKENLINSNIDSFKHISSDEWYLRYLSFKGLNSRFDSKLEGEVIFELIRKLETKKLEKKLTLISPEELKELSLTHYSKKKEEILKTLDKEKQNYIERLEYELIVIHEMGFEAYFLIVADYINWARDKNIPVGPGRGSVAGSLMAYLIGITDLNPLDYGLLFERFLNPARISMPDIDTDFADSDRDKVVDYCRRKYGEDKVAQICTFGTFAARAAIKDVGRVLGIPFSDMNLLAKLVPEKAGTKLSWALENSLEFKEAYENGTYKKDSKKIEYKEIIDNALKIEGNVRQLGVHACAVIISPENINNFTALQRPPKDPNITVTQYSAYPLEDLGLLKMDFLGLTTLTIIKKTCEIIKKTKNIDINMTNLNLEDKKVFEIFSAGDTTGIFQFESDGIRKYVSDLKPNCFDDIVVMVSLYRPGPLQYIPTYIDRKHGKEKIEYPHPSLKEILSPTHGIAVYQEQIMKMVQVFAGFSLGEADILRRAIGKKKVTVLIAQKRIFIEAAKKEGHNEKLAKHIFEDIIEPFANYGFNKSHGACYAYIAYQTAFLKAYYLTEFLTALMICDEDNIDRVALEVNEAKSKNISILAPSINESLKHFTYINDKSIRFGLKAIKGLGESAIEKIIFEREKIKGKKIKNIESFIKILGKEVINKKSLEALILSGSLDDLGNRGNLYNSINEMIRFSKRNDKKNETNQLGIFDNSDIFKESFELKTGENMSFEEKLSLEKEVLGFWVSGHPLDGLEKYCSKRGNNTNKLKMSIENIEKIEENKKIPKKNSRDIVQVIGIIISIRKIITKSGKNMVFLKCEGFDYSFEVVIFPKDVEIHFSKLSEGKVVIVNGYLNIDTEYNRKTVNMIDMKIATISQIREQAMDLGLYDEDIKYKINFYDNGIEDQAIVSPVSYDNNGDIEDSLSQKIEENKAEKKGKIACDLNYIIDIPSNAKKEDLFDLKDFLAIQKPGNIKVFIKLKGQIIDTKLKLGKLDSLKNWVNLKWG